MASEASGIPFVHVRVELDQMKRQLMVALRDYEKEWERMAREAIEAEMTVENVQRLIRSEVRKQLADTVRDTVQHTVRDTVKYAIDENLGTMIRKLAGDLMSKLSRAAFA